MHLFYVLINTYTLFQRITHYLLVIEKSDKQINNCILLISISTIIAVSTNIRRSIPPQLKSYFLWSIFPTYFIHNIFEGKHLILLKKLTKEKSTLRE